MTRIEDTRDRPAYTGPRSRRLRRIMETPPGFWLSRGIALTFLLFVILFLILWLVPLERFGGVSLIDHLMS